MMKKLCYFLLAIICLTGMACEGNEPKETEQSLINTKWKLVEVRELSMVSGMNIIDYSLYNVIFEFKTNGVLTVSDTSEHFDRFPEIGEHSYSIIDNSQLYIENRLWWYSISSEELILDNSPFDGDIYYFIKID